MKIIRTD